MSEMLSSPVCKNISVPAYPKSNLYRSRPTPLEGRIAIVTDAGRDAVDAAASGTQRESQGEMNLVSDKTACRPHVLACVRPNRVGLAPVAVVKFSEWRRRATASS